MAKETRKPFGYVAVTLIPTGIGFVMGAVDRATCLHLQRPGYGHTGCSACRDAFLVGTPQA